MVWHATRLDSRLRFESSIQGRRLQGIIVRQTLLTLFSPVIAEVGLKFGPAEFCSMMLLGLVAASSMSSGSAAKGLCAMVLGLLNSALIIRFTRASMLDMKWIRENPEIFDKGLARRGRQPLSRQVIALDSSLRALKTRLQEAQAERNARSKEIGIAKSRGEDVQAVLDAVGALKTEIQDGEERERALLAPSSADRVQLRDVRIDYAWGGTLAITMNRLPCFTRVAPNVLSASGYSGHGVAMATLAGKLLAEAAQGESPDFDLLASLAPDAFPGSGALRWRAGSRPSTCWRRARCWPNRRAIPSACASRANCTTWPGTSSPRSSSTWRRWRATRASRCACWPAPRSASRKIRSDLQRPWKAWGRA